ncbi:MAG: rhodanese-like domain-containing protein [Aquificae bacterium]|nr:rhodanese-like domain-containing protein [Aquificota bacterium]
MKRMLIGLFVSGLLVSGVGYSLDWQEAKEYEQFFSHFNQENLAKSPCRIKPDKLINWIKKGEDVVLLDIRTPGEASIVGLTYDNSIHIPLDKLFKKENLERIPKDKKVVVICRSGTRAIVAVAFLQKLGFKNVYALKGGIKGLASYLSPKTTLGLK